MRHAGVVASITESDTADDSETFWVKLAAEYGLDDQTAPADVCAEILRCGLSMGRADALQDETPFGGDHYRLLLAAEVAFRHGSAEVFALVSAIQPQLVLEESADVSAWTAALLADLALATTSPESLAMILTSSYPGDGSDLSQISLLRIRRAALTLAGLDATNWPKSRMELADVDAQFLAVGAAEEAATTACVSAAVDVIHNQPGAESVLDIVLAACERLIDLQTDRSPTALLLAIGACHIAEDPQRLAVLAEQAAPVFSASTWQALTLQLFTSTWRYRQTFNSADLNDAEDAFGLLLERFPQPWLLVPEAHNLLDYGRLEPARRTDMLAHSIGLLTGQTLDGLNALRTRVTYLAEPSDENIDCLHGVIDTYDGHGASGQAALFALRASIDCLRTDRSMDAANFLARATSLQTGRSITRTETRVAELGRRVTDFHPKPVVNAHVLRDEAIIEVHGQPVGVGPMSKRLLALLIGVPQGMPLPQVLDSLYPELPETTARSRLNLLLHRLRGSLRCEPDELITRSQTSLALVSSAWRVDAWDFVRLATHPAYDARMRAYALYQDNFFGAFGVYDESLQQIRQDLKAQWCDVAISLLEDGKIDSDSVAETADRLDIRFPRLLAALSRIHA